MPVNPTTDDNFYRSAFTAFTQSAVDAIILIEQDGSIKLFNPAAEKIFGYDSDEVLGQNISMIMPEPYRSEHDGYLENYKATGHRKIIGIGREALGQRKDGSIFPINLTISEMQVNGKSYYNGIVRDLSDVKRTESEIVEQNELLSAIFRLQCLYIAEEKTDKIFYRLLNEILTITNSEYGFIGEIKHDGSGKPFLKTRAITNIAWNEETRKFYDEGRPDGLEFRELDNLFGYTVKTGEMVLTNSPKEHPQSKGIPEKHPPLNSYLGVPLHYGGRFIGMIGLANRKEGYDERLVNKLQILFSTVSSFIDTYQNKKKRELIEAELKVHSERLKRSQIYANIGTWDWNIETGELFWSDQIAPLFGYPTGNLETTYENFLNAVHENDRQSVIDAVNTCITDGVEYNIEHRCVWPDGTVRWLLEKGDVQRDDEGKPLRMLGVVQDITKRKHAEDNLLKAKEEAEKANESKSMFLSKMSHELRTPLNAILGFAQLMELDEELPEDQLENANEISKAGSHLLDLINDILDLSKIEVGKLSVSIESVDVDEIVNHCIELIEPMARKNNISIESDFDFSDINHVYADYTRLKQVFINLLSNAVKYNRPDGNVVISCKVLSTNRLRVNIKDTGAGIPEKKQKSIFKAFERLDMEGSAIEGTGIGLLITKSLVELMGGNIGFRSQSEVGSEFWVEFPLASEHQGADEESQQIKLAEDSIGSTGSEYKIVYIEDNDVNLLLVQKFFDKFKNIELFSAKTGHQGVLLCSEIQPDLILLDINLPDINGIEVLARIKQDASLKDIPVIAVSANAIKEDIDKGFAAGFDDYLVKPLKLTGLQARLENILGVEGREAQK